MLLPIASKLVSAKYENYINTGLLSVTNILRHFQPQMVQIKTTPVGKGVDIAREDRLKKLDECIEKFSEFYQSKSF